MELHGEIISKHVDQIRIHLYEKNQVVDVFYTESHKFDIEKLIERQKIIFSVKIQSIDYYSLKLGKFWLHEILIPAKPVRETSHRGKGNGPVNWAESRLKENKENKFEEYPE